MTQIKDICNGDDPAIQANPHHVKGNLKSHILPYWLKGVGLNFLFCALTDKLNKKVCFRTLSVDNEEHS